MKLIPIYIPDTTPIAALAAAFRLLGLDMTVSGSIQARPARAASAKSDWRDELLQAVREVRHDTH